MKQPGFSNSLIDGSIRHNADVKWIKALFIAGMSPYQSVTQTKNTARARELLQEVQKQKSTPRRLKERARHVIRKHLTLSRKFRKQNPDSGILWERDFRKQNPDSNSRQLL